VLLDGTPVNACLTLAVEADGCEILTIEGLCRDGKLSELQQAFIELGAVQCGYCSPGMILTAQGLLAENPNLPSRTSGGHWQEICAAVPVI